MAVQIKNTLSFVDLAPGASIVLPHGLNNGSRTLAPDIVFIPSPDLDVVTDETNVTLTNVGGFALSGAVLVEWWHTIERAFGGVQNVDLPVKPYVVVSAERLNAPCPAFVLTTITLYARMAGDDTSGRGTLAEPYRTVVRAVCDIPNPLPPGTRWVIDDSGVGGVPFTEVFPDNYTLPAFVCPELIEPDITDPYFFYRGAVAIRATPQLVSTLSVADATVDLSDIFSIVANPKSGLLTITLDAPRPAWGGNALRGKFVVDPANPLAHCTIGESTEDGGSNGGATILISEITAPTTPFTIREPSAHLSGANTVSGRGALSIFNCGSIEISGQRIVSDVGDYGLFTAGAGFQIVQMCELEGPNCELSNNSQGRLIRSWVKTFCYLTGNFFHINGLFDQCFFYSPIANAPAIPQIRSMIFDGCDPIEVVSDSTGAPQVLLPAATPALKLNNTLIRNGVGDGIKFHGVCGHVEDVDVYGCVGNGITVDAGHGLLNLFGTLGVGTTGPANGGVGVRVNDGLQTKVNAATSTPLSGTGDSFTLAGTTVTLVDATAPFTPPSLLGTPSEEGTTIVIAGATTPGNDGAFIITRVVSPTTIEYTNALGATEAFGVGTTWTMQPLTGVGGDMHVGDGAVRTWSDFVSGASGRPALNELDITAIAGTGGTLSDDAPVPAYATGTCSRLFQ